MQTGFISAFPGVGKSFIHKNALDLGLYPLTKEGYACTRQIRRVGQTVVYDSDSSTFDKANFPGNYIQHLKDIIQRETPDPFIVLMSSHDTVRAGMREAGIPYTLVFPSRELKEEYLVRYKDRGSSEQFIKFIDTNWDDLIDSCEQDPSDKIILGPTEYLNNRLN